MYGPTFARVSILTELLKTNNATIAFKASTERLYLPEPHFYKFLAKNPIQTSPAINRGYWLRMKAIEWVVRQFLEKPVAQKKVIINLGCGYDPLPFQWLARENTLCSNTKFVDVDYEPLLETKRGIIANHPEMRDLLHSDVAFSYATDPAILIDSQEYAAIGCDLRNLPKLTRLLASVVNLEDSIVLCIAEDSTSYMRTEAADALVAWTSTLSTDVTLCDLEACSPDQPDNPFTAKMTSYYAKQGTPLRSNFKYCGRHTHTQRLVEAGFTQIEYQNLWELWARFLSPSQRMALDHIEPFDEWEEFALFASHYALVVAHNREDHVLPGINPSRRNSDASDESNISARTSSPNNPDSQLTAFSYYRAPGNLCERHHGSAYPIPGQTAIAIYGGQGPESCRATSAVCRPRYLKEETPTVLPPEVAARCCHMCTPMSNGDIMLVGGRASPSHPLRDCWLQKGDTWHRIHDLPEPRYRCRIVSVTLPDNVFGAVCLGGKTGPSNVATDILLWEPSNGWRVLPSLRNHPVPRFGPNFIRLGFNHGLLFGGMRQDGVVCQDFWRWKLVIRDNIVVGISFRPSHAFDASIGAYPFFARFGASYGFVQDTLLVIGGIAKGGCIPKPYEILSLTGSFATLHDEPKDPNLRVSSVEPVRPPDCPRPFLIGHSTQRTQTGMFVIISGGATCFHFGKSFNKGIWVLHDKEAGISADWIIVPSRPSAAPGIGSEPSVNGADPQPDGYMVKRVLLRHTKEFLYAVRWCRPLIMAGLDFGSCTELWTLQYLREKTAPPNYPRAQDTNSGTANTTNADFHSLLEQTIIMSSNFYPDTLTTSMPAQTAASLEEMPTIAPDFRIPGQLMPVEAHMQSVHFHVSNGIMTSPRYSVTGTIIFQIRGAKKLVLFPPADITELAYPAASNTSEQRVFSNTGRGLRYSLHAPMQTDPHLAVLKPGETLLIPPFWSYAHVPLFHKARTDGLANLTNGRGGETATIHDGYASADSSTSVSSLSSSSEHDHLSARYDGPASSTFKPRQISHLDIAVSVSFPTLVPSWYTTQVDDGEIALAAYEDGRLTVDKLVKSFTCSSRGSSTNTRSSDPLIMDSIPKDVAKALLKRLGRELFMKADEL
ncbi:tRNA methyltransferase ppm2 [Exophiala sideris]|uniref:tRNA wybutosine-synthesizing protein 4 n=1 Tax=Exophiala sideris TaxID=1016849 RepID=A0ABR0JB69_9EURO|nr:tRNA methyltransferase ppm2 [Exophiala sideris]KAK5038660.1 tRNA methyltransferase ppm2 [Exophiala sideris]KAK5060541.1 tRNA methyltransferase ppm2 [Exophiala sideris]KAK5183453.1 tRNA methyltransferase ppm2 [Eurotiomycetes sp. CCFEE 6388]